MKIKTVISSACLWGAELPDIIRFSCTAGFDGLEIWAEQLGPRPDTAALRRLADNAGLALSVHAASWDLNLCSHNSVMRKSSIAEVKRSIDIAAELDAESITVHPGRMGSPLFSESFYHTTMTDALVEICRYGADAGVDVSLELMEKIPREFITTPEAMNRLLRAVSPLPCGVTLDAAHLDSAEMFFDYFAALFPRVDKIHLSNRRGNTYHVPVFQGDIDMLPILDMLKNQNLPVVIEGTLSSREELAWTLNRIRSLLKKEAA